MTLRKQNTAFPQPTEASIAQTSQTEIHYRFLPGNGETVVYLHSLGCTLGMWSEVAQACAPYHSGVLYDLRGHGRSKPKTEVQSIDDHVVDLIELLDFLRLKTVALAGVSIGGLIAMAAAISHPERFSKLILTATDARIGTVESWNQRIASITTQSLPKLSSAIAQRWFSPLFLEQKSKIAEAFTKELSATSEKSYLASCAVLRDTDLRRSLKQIEIPTLIIGGKVDLAIPIDAIKELSNAIPRSQLLCLDQTGHLPPVEHPQEVADAILKFMSST